MSAWLHDSDLPLTAHVTVLRGAHGGRYPDGNSVVVRGADGVVLIDPSLTVHGRAGLGERVDRVLISHAHEDHIAGLSTVDATHVGVHEADLLGVRSVDGIMEVYGLHTDAATAGEWRNTLVQQFHLTGRPDAMGFADGATWDLGGVNVTALHLPGHTRGHTAFLVEPDGVAYVGDIDLTGFGPYYGDHWSDLDAFVRSIARAEEIEARWYATFHQKGVVEGREEFLAQLRRFAAVIDRRDERLLELIGQGPATVDRLVDEGIVYRPGTRPAGFGESVEWRTITLHLERLARQGVVALGADDTVHLL